MSVKVEGGSLRETHKERKKITRLKRLKKYVLQLGGPKRNHIQENKKMRPNSTRQERAAGTNLNTGQILSKGSYSKQICYSSYELRKRLASHEYARTA